MLSKLAVRRLTTLADYMDTVRPTKKLGFDMSFYYRETECGVTMCAAGFATQVPSFKRAGLRLGKTRFLTYITYKKQPSTIDSLMVFFDISYDSEHFLFHFHENFHFKTPKQWAKMCRKFIKESAEVK